MTGPISSYIVTDEDEEVYFLSRILITNPYYLLEGGKDLVEAMESFELLTRLSSMNVSSIYHVKLTQQEESLILDILEEYDVESAKMSFLNKHFATRSTLQLKAIFTSAIDGLSALHARGLFHGGLSLDVISMSIDGTFRLLHPYIAILRRLELKHPLIPNQPIHQDSSVPSSWLDSSYGPETDVFDLARCLLIALYGASIIFEYASLEEMEPDISIGLPSCRLIFF